MDRRSFLVGSGAVALGALASCSTDEAAAPITESAASTTSTPTSSTTASSPTTALIETTTTTTTTTVPTTPIGPATGPWWLRDNFAPVATELDATDLRVLGEIPAGLQGTWVRNGPNPSSGESVHWFDGDAMLHGLRLREGRADWYGRRYVQTPYLADVDASELVVPGGAVTRASVSSVSHGGKLLALGEVGFPYEIDIADLSTIGPDDYGGALQTAMTAHPKIDPSTGELCFFGYDFRPPFLTYHVADASGQLVKSVPIELANGPMMHDFAITPDHAIFMDMGVRFNVSAGLDFPFLFDRAHQCRIGVLDRAATSDSVRWFDVESGFVFHTINARQNGDIITVDVIHYPELWTESSNEVFPPSLPYRYTIDLTSGTVQEGPLDDRWVEFPMIDRRLTGLGHDVSWSADLGPTISEPRGSTLVQHRADGSSNSAASYRVPGTDVMGEPLFVPDPDRAAGDGGWIMLAVYRRDENRSDVVILDAASIADGPVATIELPDRVPYGFHASFTPLDA